MNAINGFFSFAEPLVVSALIAAAAGFGGGLLAPLVQGLTEDWTTKRRIALEAAVARQKQILDAQSDLLDALTGAMWKWRYLSTKTTFRGGDAKEKSMDTVLAAYDKELWPILDEVRFATSRARRLLSQSAYDKLLRVYEERIVPFGRRMHDAFREQDAIRRGVLFLELNAELLGRVTEDIEDSLMAVAFDVGLTIGTLKD
jgi:hypothetical protein